jgi:hydrogenase nickel incorporation protein HypA/HybF
MHEASLMQSALDLAIDAARRAGAERISRIGLCIGAASGVVPEALALAFEVLRQGTPAAGAELSIETRPARYRCPTCSTEFLEWGECPRCGELGTELIGGTELELSTVEVPDP